MSIPTRFPPVVLVVDDDPLMRCLLTHLLHGSVDGYEVVTVADGEQALAQLTQRDVPLLITDYNMPGMTGVTLATQVKARWPETWTVLMSADHVGDLEGRPRMQSVDGFLLKPFPPHHLLAIVAQVLADGARPPG
jgi:two-component system, response regulator, stage 0 sporulation protein F